MDSEEDRKRKRERAHELMDRLSSGDLSLVRLLMDRLLVDAGHGHIDEKEQVEIERAIADSYQSSDGDAIRAFLMRQKKSSFE